ncbi:MAG: prohibitin family protein [Acidobacteriota bacterium]|nr:prohibitin family protein [Acidobacteriota bacterium]
MPEIVDRHIAATEQWIHRHALAIVSVGILLLLFFIAFYNNMVIPIDSGHRGVRWSRFFGGTVLSYSYGEGVQVIPPWDRMYIYNARVQEITSRVTVLAAGELDIQIEFSVRFQPRLGQLPRLHQLYGPDYAQKLVVQEVQSALQDTIGAVTFDRLADRDGFSASMSTLVTEATKQLGRELVTIDDVVIRKITLPPAIAQAIHRKFEEQQLMLLYDYRLDRERKEALRKRIEAEGIRTYQQIVSTTLSDRLIAWKGVDATLELAKSDNAKIVIIGNTANGLPIIFDRGTGAVATPGGTPP